MACVYHSETPDGVGILVNGVCLSFGNSYGVGILVNGVCLSFENSYGVGGGGRYFGYHSETPDGVNIPLKLMDKGLATEWRHNVSRGQARAAHGTPTARQ